ncbi:type 2 isopentenyl-diphosphate Delta-isomerase [candidate division KSB1 bacterium]|nr:type 2 isopentenyl-diphosphate Delta-isomerase [candidate division KSB1 bacterium]
MSISKRKQEHIDIAMNQSVKFTEKTNGFEHYDLVHCALPELNVEDIHPQIQFLNKPLSSPLMITAMTGGFEGAKAINAALAEACQSEGVALGLGSQRQMLEDENYLDSFTIAREKGPDIVLVGNIGAVQLVGMTNLSPVCYAVERIEADALAVHLNVLQEVLQPEGNIRFKGMLHGIEKIVKELDVPVIVKEIGCGISREVALKLVDVGVTVIDVAGAGGTSWAGIESHRADRNALAGQFWNWGIPTAVSLEMISDIESLTIIASGGIDNGITMAKAIALGADLCGAALPFLHAYSESGADSVAALIRQWKEAYRTALLLTGCQDTISLQNRKPLRTC